MAYIQGISREQQLLLPERVEDYVGEESIVRVVDLFVDNMKCGDKDTDLPPMREMNEAGGRLGYSPHTYAKLLIWGYLNKSRSSRDLEKATHQNLEVIWLLGKLHPDYSSICRFRAANAKRIPNWLKHFNGICAQLGCFGGEEIAVDGTLLKAVNSKDKNWTQKRITKCHEKQQKQIDEYLARLEKAEKEDQQNQLPPSEIEGLKTKLEEIKQALQLSEDRMAQAKASPTGQYSEVDPDARLLKKKAADGTSIVGFNAQCAVDSRNHLIAAVDVTHKPSDFGQLTSTMNAAVENITAEEKPDDAPKVRALADAGYASFEDIAAAEAAGFETYVAVTDNSNAGKRGLFERSQFTFDAINDCYRCPEDKVLHRHADSESHGINYHSYYNTSACRDCPVRNQCTGGKYRKMRRHPNQSTIDIMKQRMNENPEVYKRRASTVEHPFGSMLFWNNGRTLLCRGLEKAKAEFSLSALAYNFKRALAVVGFKKMMEAFA